MMSSRIREKYGIRDAYGDYRFKVDNPVSLDMYIEIASGFFKFLVQSMLDGLHVKLPSKMGDIFVVGKKTKMKIGEDGEIKGFAPDWKETKKLWERCEECRLRKQFVYHLNEATNGVRYRLHWSKKVAMAENKSLYSLQFTRSNRRTASANIQGGKEYIVN